MNEHNNEHNVEHEQEFDLLAVKPRNSAVQLDSGWGGGSGQPLNVNSDIGYNGALPQALHSVRRWWKWTLPTGLILAMSIAALLFLQGSEQNYRASCWFQINVQREFIVFPSEEDSSRFLETQIELVGSPLVLGPVAQDPEIASFLLQKELESHHDWLAKQIEVSVVGQSEFLEIALSVEDRDMAQKIVEAVAESYRAIYEQDIDRQTQRVISLLEEEKERAANQVQRRRDDVRMQSKLATGIDPFAVSGANSPQALNALQRSNMATQIEFSLMKFDVDLNDARNELRRIADTAELETKEFGVNEDEIDEYVSRDLLVNDLKRKLSKKQARAEGLQVKPTEESELSELRAHINTLENRIQSAQSSARENAIEDLGISDWRAQLSKQSPNYDEALIEKKIELYPTITLQESQLEVLEKELEALGERYRSDRLPEKYTDLEQAVAKQKTVLEFTKDEVKSLLLEEKQSEFDRAIHTTLAQFDRQVSQLRRSRSYRDLYQNRLASINLDSAGNEDSGTITLDLEFARNELEREEQIHQRISDRMLVLRTEERAPRRVTRRTENAILTNMADSSRFNRKMTLFLLAGFCLPFGLAFLWDVTHKKITDGRQLQEQWGIPVLGEIAMLPQPPAFLSIGSVRKRAEQNETFDESILNLASQISCSTTLHCAKVLVLSSAVGGEGKSTISTQLAAGLARVTRKRVLLIDGDLRSPSVGQMLAIEESTGLAEVLKKKSSLKEAVQKSPIEHMYVLPAGEADADTHYLFNGDRLTSLIKVLRQEFEFILFDTAPILTAGESLAIAKIADATILCTLRDRSTVTQVGLTLEKLASVGSRTVGAVISGVPADQYRKTYGDPSGSHELRKVPR